MTDTITKPYVENRISDWTGRLNALFDEVESWVSDSKITIKRSEITQRNEDLMSRFDVAPRMVPTLSLFKDKHRIAFVSSALWVIGADGRVNITTNDCQYILVDMRKDHDTVSDWRVVDPDIRRNTRKFNKTRFRGLLQANK